MFDIGCGPARCDCVFVSEYQDALVVAEESVDVFETSLGCFGIEEINHWHKGEVENGPDDVEFPVQTLNPYWRYLDHCSLVSLKIPCECTRRKGIPI